MSMLKGNPDSGPLVLAGAAVLVAGAALVVAVRIEVTLTILLGLIIPGLTAAVLLLALSMGWFIALLARSDERSRLRIATIIGWALTMIELTVAILLALRGSPDLAR